MRTARDNLYSSVCAAGQYSLRSKYARGIFEQNGVSTLPRLTSEQSASACPLGTHTSLCVHVKREEIFPEEILELSSNKAVKIFLMRIIFNLNTVTSFP